MKSTSTKTYGASEVAVINTNPSSTMFQITASGAAGTLSVEAQTAGGGPKEMVKEKSTDTAAVQIDLTVTSTIATSRPYSIACFLLTPTNVTGNYTVTFSEWN